MYSNIKLCRCQLKIHQNHQNIDKKLVYQILKSPAIEMIAGLNFNIQMIYLSKKGSEKGSDSVDLYCNVVKFRISKIALNQGFSHLLTCSESLFHLCKHNVFAKFW